MAQKGLHGNGGNVRKTTVRGRGVARCRGGKRWRKMRERRVKAARLRFAPRLSSRPRPFCNARLIPTESARTNEKRGRAEETVETSEANKVAERR